MVRRNEPHKPRPQPKGKPPTATPKPAPTKKGRPTPKPAPRPAPVKVLAISIADLRSRWANFRRTCIRDEADADNLAALETTFCAGALAALGQLQQVPPPAREAALQALLQEAERRMVALNPPDPAPKKRKKTS